MNLLLLTIVFLAKFSPKCVPKVTAPAVVPATKAVTIALPPTVGTCLATFIPALYAPNAPKVLGKCSITLSKLIGLLLVILTESFTVLAKFSKSSNLKKIILLSNSLYLRIVKYKAYNNNKYINILNILKKIFL